MYFSKQPKDFMSLSASTIKERCPFLAPNYLFWELPQFLTAVMVTCMSADPGWVMIFHCTTQLIADFLARIPHKKDEGSGICSLSIYVS